MQPTLFGWAIIITMLRLITIHQIVNKNTIFVDQDFYVHSDFSYTQGG